MAGSLRSDDGDLGFQIAPMVDVVFVLMLFFMACAGWQVVERRLTIRLPSSRPAVPHSTEDLSIVIEISAEGQIVANNQTFGTPEDHRLSSFRDWLKATQAFGGEDPVIIRPNAATRHERIIDVLNACQAAGISKISFAP
jgi:biopolymer transport protein ExbD